MRGHRSAVYCTIYDRTGRWLITGADDRLLKVSTTTVAPMRSRGCCATGITDHESCCIVQHCPAAEFKLLSVPASNLPHVKLPRCGTCRRLLAIADLACMSTLLLTFRMWQFTGCFIACGHLSNVVVRGVSCVTCPRYCRSGEPRLPCWLLYVEVTRPR